MMLGFSSDYNVGQYNTSSKNGCDLIYQIADNKGFNHIGNGKALNTLFVLSNFFRGYPKQSKQKLGESD